MSKELQSEIPFEVEQLEDNPTPASDQTPEEQKMSKREFDLAMRRLYKERNEKIKQNKEMLKELQLEVDYWKAQADLLRYRYEKMDFYIKNLDLEPTYLARKEEQRIKEEGEQPAPTTLTLS